MKNQHKVLSECGHAVNLPLGESRRGIYFLMRLKQIVYIGKTDDYLRRIPQHTHNKEFDDVFFVPVNANREMPLGQYELACIRVFQPALNNSRDRSTKDNPIEWDLRVLRELLGPATVQRMHNWLKKRASDMRAPLAGETGGNGGE